MNRQVLSKSGTRQRAVMLPLETFLAITDMPASQRQDCGGGNVKVKDNFKTPPSGKPFLQRRASLRCHKTR